MKCGKNIKVSFNDGVMTFSGKGTIPSFDKYLPSDIDKNDVREVVIEEGITKIGTSAFYGFEKLEKVSFSSTIKAIGDTCFCRCNSIKTLTLPNNITDIGFCAFNEMSGLKEINFPDELSFYQNILMGSDNVERINGVDCKEFLSIGGSLIEYRGDPTKEEITIPSYITDIGSDVFKYCGENNIKKINISENTKFMTPFIFEDLDHLESFTDGKIDNGFISRKGTLIGCLKDDREITVPSYVDTIGPFCFAHCRNVEIVTLHNNIKEICDRAFIGLKNLKEVKGIEFVKQMGEDVFYNCEKYTK